MMTGSRPSQRSLADRILDSFPCGSYGLLALLRVLEIVESEQVETAAIECRAQPRLVVNPRFVERHCATSEKLFVLVMHELHHVLLGHTHLFPRVTAADNLVFDAVINALLCRMFPQPEHTSLFTDFYSDAEFPTCLLRPPRGWRPDRAASLPPGLTTAPWSLRDAYRALYSPVGAAYSDLYLSLAAAASETPAGAVLLGHHGDGETSSAAGRLEARSPVLLDVVREIVERWPQPRDPIRGRSLASVLRRDRLDVGPPSAAALRLRDLIRRVAGERVHRGTRRRWRVDPVPVATPLPSFDRRSIVLGALGVPTLLHQTDAQLPRRLLVGERVHVYVDVSGSTEEVQPAIYSAVVRCRALVHPLVHLFSTKVADVPLAECRRGTRVSTQGTDIGCVVDHVEKNRVRRAVLVTDGMVGRAAGRQADILRRMPLGVALIGASRRDDLASFADHWVGLDESPQPWPETAGPLGTSLRPDARGRRTQGPGRPRPCRDRPLRSLHQSRPAVGTPVVRRSRRRWWACRCRGLCRSTPVTSPPSPPGSLRPDASAGGGECCSVSAARSPAVVRARPAQTHPSTTHHRRGLNAAWANCTQVGQRTALTAYSLRPRTAGVSPQPSHRPPA